MISYADHDVHHVRHALDYRSAADAGPDTSTTDVQEFEITERGLDPDELAELRAMRVQYAVFAFADAAQDSRGAIRVEAGAGFNLSGGEFLLDNDGRAITGIDVDDSGTDDFNSITKDTDEVGQIWTAALGTQTGFDDDTNGNGAGAPGVNDAEFINMSEAFGSGPFVDSADDFVSRIKMSVDNSIETCTAKVLYSLYYDVNQVEGGRSRFGR